MSSVLMVCRSKVFPSTAGGEEGEKQYPKCTSSAVRASSSATYTLVHDTLGQSSGLPSTLTVAQLMAALRQDGHPPASHVSLTLTNRRDTGRGKCLTWTSTLKTKTIKLVKQNYPWLLTITQLCSLCIFFIYTGGDGEGARELALLSLAPLPSTLHVFTSQGGLSLLAQHMSLLYPDMAQQVRTSSNNMGATVFVPRDDNAGNCGKSCEPKFSVLAIHLVLDLLWVIYKII